MVAVILGPGALCETLGNAWSPCPTADLSAADVADVGELLLGGALREHETVGLALKVTDWRQRRDREGVEGVEQETALLFRRLRVFAKPVEVATVGGGLSASEVCIGR